MSAHAGDTRPIQDLQERLASHYGPTGWWPGETAFEIMVGAILVQNTAWRNAELAVRNLAEAGLLDPTALAACPLDAVRRLVRPAGYYNQKSERIRAFAVWIVTEFDGSIDAMRLVPCDEMHDSLLARKGIGPETADSILCYALGHPVFVADAYTRRIFARHGLAGESASYHRLQRIVADSLPAGREVYAELHAHIVCIGKDFCTPRRPNCGQCPLNGWHEHETAPYCG